MTGSRIAAGNTRVPLPSQHPASAPLLPAQRGAATGAAAEFSTPIAPGRAPGLRALLIHHDPASTRESADALTEAGFDDVIVSDDADDATLLPPPDPRTDIAAVSVATAEDAAIDLSALRRLGWQRVIAVVSDPDAATTTAALRHGATGAVWSGGTPPAADHVPTGVYDLSTREVEVLRMVADGRANKWIGDQLDLSALTVKSHLARIGRKLGTGERAHMVMLALRAGVIS